MYATAVPFEKELVGLGKCFKEPETPSSVLKQTKFDSRSSTVCALKCLAMFAFANEMFAGFLLVWVNYYDDGHMEGSRRSRSRPFPCAHETEKGLNRC